MTEQCLHFLRDLSFFIKYHLYAMNITWTSSLWEKKEEGGSVGRGGGSGMCVVFFVKSSTELERISQSVMVLLRKMMMKRRRIDHQQQRRRKRKRRICYELVTIYASDHGHSTSTRRETPQNIGTPNSSWYDNVTGMLLVHIICRCNAGVGLVNIGLPQDPRWYSILQLPQMK